MAILRVENLRKSFGNSVVLKDISFEIGKGECLGIAGASGCGKTTAARIVSGLETADFGRILVQGKAINDLKRKEFYRTLQLIFQDAYMSFNPKFRLGDSMMEPLINYGYKKSQAMSEMLNLLEEVGLNREIAKKYPHEVSGGECQRCAIARALALRPKLIICDEITSSLDVTVQLQIIRLIQNIKEKYETSFIIISHDLALIQLLCDRVVILGNGRIAEEGESKDIIRYPKNIYTKKLVNSIMEI